MEKSALVIDYRYCTGCHSCEVACRQEKGFSVEEWGIKVSEQGPVKLNGSWMWNYVPVPSDICDLCAERVESGKRPACVHHCLAQCMEVVPLSDLAAKLEDIGNGAACFIPKAR